MHTLYVVQSGIIGYWEAQTAAKYQNWKLQLAIATSRRKENPLPSSLSFDRVSGCFILWGVGCGISSLVYVIELLFVRLYRRTVCITL